MQTVTVTNGNLFQLAAKYLGDATQWIRIAQVNGYTDPQLVGTVTVTLPTVDLTATGARHSND